MAEIQAPRTMTVHPHQGHGPILEALARARTRNTLPATLLVYGDRGVGKQHLALWLARLILCSEPEESGPCGRCRNCKMAAKLEHPDLHWYFPLTRPKKVSGPEKLAQALEDARMDRLSEIRANPLRSSHSSEPRSLYLAAARSLRQRAQKKPSQGEHQVFILAEAEALAPNDSSSEAANSLLKLLEEPPPGTVLILTSNEPGRLLPTIRSRSTQLHLPPLPRNEVEAFLTGTAGVDREEARRLAALSGGSIGRALGFMADDGEPGALEQTRDSALGLVQAVVSSEPSALYESASAFPSFGARGLQELLNFVEEWLRDLARSGTGVGGLEAATADAVGLERSVRELQIPPSALAASIAKVEEAKALAAGNVNPQLVIFGLLRDLRSEWIGPGPSAPARS